MNIVLKGLLLCCVLFGVIRECDAGSGSDAPNVLFIAVDDLRPELGCYDHSNIQSPNIDAFAASGRMFTRAYCQQAVCNPSRTSLMTGMRPDSIGVTGNHSHFRVNHPEVVTLSQHFKNHGYHSAAIGKIYHGVFPEGSSSTKWDTMGDPDSWSVPAVRFGPRYYYTETGIAAAKKVYDKIYKPSKALPDDWTKKLVFGPATESPEVTDSTLYDGKVADAAVEALRGFESGQQPFFLAVGFIKPHSPYIAPKKYFDLYDQVQLADQPEFPSGAPDFAGHGSGELRRYTDQPASGPIPPANQRRIRQAYYACVSYIDSQIGRVLSELDRTGLSENTIVVLWGDHGYHLGEQGLWGKTTNFELDTRVPLIIRTPKMQSAGRASSSLVELIDLYPTLVELAGLPIPSQLEGKSLVPILKDPDQVIKRQAFSQHPRGGGLMGYSMRTEQHRFTQWLERSTGQVKAVELYDYSSGLVETENLASRMPDLVKELAVQLQEQLLIGRPTDSVSEASYPTEANVVKESEMVRAGMKPVSFEELEPGGFRKLQTTLGTWTPELGRTIVDPKHAKSGKRCLQLMGDQATSVTLKIADDVDTTGVLSFWAERWTVRTPFRFRIEKDSGNGWEEIFNGDTEIRVGRAFLNYVEVPLGDPRIERLRFKCMSPPNTGVLIDDICITPAKPQEIISVEVIPFNLPMLLGAEAGPLAKLKITTRGTVDPLFLTGVRASLSGSTDSTPIQSVFLSRRAGGSPSRESQEQSGAAWSVGNSMQVKSSIKLEDGENILWINARLKSDVGIGEKVGAAVTRVDFNDGSSRRLDRTPPSMQRIGVAVREAGDDGNHTYRIPGLATTGRGTLIGVYDIRRLGGGDLPGDIDVGMSRSTDGGRSWEPMKVIMDMGNDPALRYDGVGDPAILVDKKTGTIWVAALWSHGNRGWFGSEPGLEPTETGQLILVKSEDDGVTWSKPINVTQQVKKPEWSLFLQGPGKGITMRDGTLVFAAQYQASPTEGRLPYSTILFSKDHGKTWEAGTGALGDTTEAQVVEIEPGTLMLNCRYNRESVRAVMVTKDMGKTWRHHVTSCQSLIEPRACMASLIDVDQELGQELGGWLLFSNPDSKNSRSRMMIKASPDRGVSWPKQSRMLLDEGKSAGYSCMTMVDSETVGILYEGSQSQMTFQRIPLSEIMGEVSQVDEPPARQSLRLPRVFGHDMVLQCDVQIPVWGVAEAGESVVITLGEDRQRAIANDLGQWQVRLKKRAASDQPLKLQIESGDDRVELTNVVIGEVWLCAGQSNMEWRLWQSTHGKESLGRGDDASLRLLNLQGGALGSSGSYQSEHLDRLSPDNFCRGRWQVASSQQARDFSAVGWYFGRYLREQLGVPVGLICPAVGGTPTEAWISREALEADPNLTGLVAGNWLLNPRLGDFCKTRGKQNLLAAIQAGEEFEQDDLGPNHSFKPGFMWDAAIEPLVPFAIRGAIWYQGESNAESYQRVQEHEKLLPLLVEQWRKHWGQGDFPFLYVQLPALGRPEWPYFRESQRRMLTQLPNLGMAVTIDSGHPSNVHPPLKKPVGERLAKWALGTTYGLNAHKNYSGPLLDGADREGDTMLLRFHHFADRLISSDEKPLRHFEVAGDDGVFYPAVAKITNQDCLSVSSNRVPVPRYVRYAWVPYPEPAVNFCNSDGLPASPFTTESEEWVSARRAALRDRPNILFIVSEDNSEHLGCYGEKRVHTPNLDQLAAGGVRYTRAYVPYSVCSPSRAAFLTGLYPRQSGHIGLATHRFSMYRDFKTMPAYFQQAGYYTGFLGKTHVNPEHVVEDFIDYRAIKESNFGKTISIEAYAHEAHEVMKKAAETEQPFFLVVNYADAHRRFVGKSKGGYPTKMVDEVIDPFPWIGSDTPGLRHELQNYFNCMNRLDEGVGMLMQHLVEMGQIDKTLVVYISDHGADFPRGKGSVYENGTRIPMIVNYPKGFPVGKVDNGMVSTLDLLPTMLRAAGIPVPDHLEGFPLQDIQSGHVPARRYIHTFTTGSSPNLLYLQFGIRDERYKLIYNPSRDLNLLGLSRYRNSQIPEEQHLSAFLYPPEYELFDLQEDPYEWENLAGSDEHQEIRSRLVKAMHEFQLQIKDPFARQQSIREFISEQKEYRNKPYKRNDFVWPHLQMFRNAQEDTDLDLAP